MARTIEPTEIMAPSEMKGVAASGFNDTTSGNRFMQALKKGAKSAWDVSSAMRKLTSSGVVAKNPVALAMGTAFVYGFAKHMINGEQTPTSIRDADWQGEKIRGQKVARLETTDMSDNQISAMKQELGNNGIDFNTARNRDGTRSSIAVSDPVAFQRLENYVKTGDPNPVANNMGVRRTMGMNMA